MASSKSTFMSASWKKGIFANKVVFCTGGSGTICSGQVRALVALGANACIVGRNRSKAEQVAAEISAIRPGSVVLGIGDVDVRDPNKVNAAVEECVRRLGGIDFVIAGAAGNFLALVDELSLNAFKAVIDIDLIGSWITVKATIPHLLRSAERHKSDENSGTGGRIIFVSSTNYHSARVAQAHVCAAKAGVNAISNVLSLEYGPRGVTSNIIAPGPIDDTEGLRRLSSPERRQQAIQSVPLQRFGLIKDIADATVFLFGDTGNFVNGACIDVDGGAWRVNGGAQPGNRTYPASVQPSKTPNHKSASRL
ncbi:uncharacterized protein Z520_05886 [Fonsecaea multimorphosa CBS 102226]|uniref:2,4-dienoyl-CoA reductase [(3E)-enoyl-CoA-producing] n=1 Tax=Fonsecaea multimorphosa CBS 102226 TaxID=1442371 RepID=A0A0D2H9N4_9EURO|nr:uncharacterized protein Z520_05886 [Fonsecaea multimorphosa CBS 102226]KIX98585.1 hypothetical protein Z520_05886 [Fonsecaea multimorphosa CBS 102226]